VGELICWPDVVFAKPRAVRFTPRVTLYQRWLAWDRSPPLRPRFRAVSLALGLLIAVALAVVLSATDAIRAWPVATIVLVQVVVPSMLARETARWLQRRHAAR
jgi:antibiotic biosynthesis monooxygenase (ABM) superfamily enzyme